MESVFRIIDNPFPAELLNPLIGKTEYPPEDLRGMLTQQGRRLIDPSRRI
jgi:hypothetical protein